jgi:hypothetical protein
MTDLKIVGQAELPKSIVTEATFRDNETEHLTIDPETGTISYAKGPKVPKANDLNSRNHTLIHD